MSMELLLIVIGGILASAIIIMVVDRISGDPFPEIDNFMDHPDDGEPQSRDNRTTGTPPRHAQSGLAETDR